MRLFSDSAIWSQSKWLTIIACTRCKQRKISHSLRLQRTIIFYFDFIKIAESENRRIFCSIFILRFIKKSAVTRWQLDVKRSQPAGHCGYKRLVIFHFCFVKNNESENRRIFCSIFYLWFIKNRLYPLSLTVKSHRIQQLSAGNSG